MELGCTAVVPLAPIAFCLFRKNQVFRTGKQTAVSKATDWDIMMKTAFDKRNDVRNDEAAPCAICMSGLERKKQVSLLSCSHMFCTSCIDAFERFTAHHATPSCPVCRMPDYEKLDVLL